MIAPYNKKLADEFGHDAGLKVVVDGVKKHIIEKNDSHFLLCVGHTGTGKSSLMLKAMELYLGDEANINYIALNEAAFIDSLSYVAEKEGLRMLINDEANLSKRDAMKSYNKDIINTYMKIRGKNIFHIWANPSADVIDKFFKDEGFISSFIYIDDRKQINRPRNYYFMKKESVLKFLQDHKGITLPLLKKHIKKYALYCGWFTAYSGHLWKAYEIEKDLTMDDQLLEMKRKYGSKTKMIKISDICRILSISRPTVEKLEKELKEKEIIKEGVDFETTPTGIRLFNKSIISTIKDFKKEART